MRLFRQIENLLGDVVVRGRVGDLELEAIGGDAADLPAVGLRQFAGNRRVVVDDALAASPRES